MPLKRISLTTTLYIFLINVIFLNLKHLLALSELPDDVAVNCGSSGSLNGIDGKQWIGDIGSKFIVTSQGSKVKTTKSTDTDPYTTARISRKHFGYVFHVSPGQKFVRMYFYPTSYPGFKRFDGFFTVKAGPYTLLSNFSASLTADVLGVSSFLKEFCLNVEENQPLFITFSPSNEAYAFVNGIEIISMPLGLYYTPSGELGTRVLGKKNHFAVDNSIALEMVHRLNVGGSSISSKDDIGLSREWSDDSNFFARLHFHPLITTVRIKYKSIPTYAAPPKVYQTSWDTVTTEQADKADNFTWKLPVDLGFRYLIRLHFCKLEYEVEESSRLKFSILINNQLAEANADIIKWSGGSGVAVFRDYVAIMEGDRMEGKRELLISLCPELSNNDDWWTENTDTILKGLEVFKLSNTDNNLAGVNLNPMPITGFSKNSNLNPKFVYARGGNFIATVIVVLISFASIIVYQLRILGENFGDSKIPLSSSESISRRFSLAEVRSATNNFDDLLVIGSGGFGLVYKGVIDGGTNVAIKRKKSESKQGAKEFLTEINMLSNLRHTHLVSLIGFCDEDGEMILVYEYMEHGTLADHLYKKRSNGGSNFNLSWKQKLNICIGAARGLDYLHTGTRHGVIHRDVKTTNILLNNEWVAKVSDFGLCKIGTTNQSYTHVSTEVKGTYGYLDPEYFYTRRLTKKSDVYAFGVVLLEVLCGRPAVDISLTEDRHSLVLWAQYCIKEGKLDELIDLNLQDQISSSCLKVLSEVVYKCLHKRPIGRPTMSDIVASLEGALLSQDRSNAKLEHKLRHMLVENRQPFEPEHMSYRPINEDVLDDRAVISSGDDSFDEVIQKEREILSQRNSEDFIIQLVRPSIIPDLKCLVNRMFDSNYDRECTQAFVSVRKEVLEECLYILEVETLSIEDVMEMEWVALNSKIRKWINTMKIFVRVYLASEKCLSDQIFEDLDSISSTCFTEASKGSILQLLNFAEAIAIGPHTPEKLLRVLDMYEVLASLIPDIEALYTDEAGSQVTNKCLDVLKRLGNCAISTFLEFKNLVASNVSNIPFAGGGIHHITRYVMNYIKNLNDYIETLNELLSDYDKEDDFSFSPGLNPTSGEQSLSQSSSYAISLTVTAIHFKSLISILERNLEDKSKLYKEDSLGHIFMMNNTHYITEKVKSSELRIIWGDEWIRKHNWKFQHYARSYERSTWSSILSLLKDDGLYNRGSSSISETLLKEKLHSFYLVFEEVYKNQTSWIIPDTQLRDDLIISISLQVIQAYRYFVGRHENRLTTIKYSSDELQVYLLDLFDGSPKSLRRK